MKHAIIITAVALIAGACTFEISAQTNAAANDSIANAVRLNSLKSKKYKLETEIKAADSKRNARIAGVSPETLEAMNNRQDSICLSLRSELVDVILEIKELSPDAATPQLLQQYNNLVNSKDNKEEQEENTQSPATAPPANKPQI